MQRNGKYRADIDGLRAVAVLSVVGYHLLPEKIIGGFVGVDVFFVISGFLISSILYTDLERKRFDLIEFYARRIRRLYPALALVLLSVMAAGWFLLLPANLASLAKQVVGGSLFVANFVLWLQSGYFSPDAGFKPLLHLWSLGVEEQYYLFFPPLCMLLYDRRRGWYLPAVLTILGVLSMVANVALAGRDSAMAFFLPFTRLWELILGAMLAWHSLRTTQASEVEGPRLTSSAMGAMGLGLIIAAVFTVSQFHPYPGWRALMPTAGSVMVIAAGQRSWVNRTILSSRPAVFVGLISYPLYLWHWPIYSYFRIAKHIWGWTIPPAMKGLTILVASFLLSWLTYRFLEVPVRKAGKSPSGRRLTLYLFGSVATSGALGFLLVLAHGAPGRFPVQVEALDHDFSAEGSNAWRSGTCFLRPDQTAKSFAKECLDSAGASRGPLVFLWGDSHGADLVSGLRDLQKRGVNFRLAQFTASLCSPVLGVNFVVRPGCKEINDADFGRLVVLKPDIVLLSAYWHFADKDHDAAILKPALLRTVNAISTAGAGKVVILGSVPEWTNDVPVLLFDQVRRHPGQPAPQRLSRHLLTEKDDAFLKEVAESSGATYLPMVEKLCDPTSCLATTGPGWQDIVTYDTTHFTMHGSALVAPLIWADIQSIPAEHSSRSPPPASAGALLSSGTMSIPGTRTGGGPRLARR